MNQPLDQVSGSILIRGRAYSAKEVIRGLLEQGIMIKDKPEGLKIGFTLISPDSHSSDPSMNLPGYEGCPFIPIMSKITDKLNRLSDQINLADRVPDPPRAEESSFHARNDDPPTSAFSPFSNNPFQSESEKERDTDFSSGSSYMDNKRKCSSCGSTLPSNAFFCNKCGNHVRSG
ncbi:MAG: zinc ribbon domain-containing protein [Candidatus Heimdallarchaeota archaeon]|nr:zinc ribbon domain-containing protein [Candidatus Heimdallarchaeota archaeon]